MLHIFISAAGEQIRPGATGKPLPGYQACIYAGIKDKSNDLLSAIAAVFGFKQFYVFVDRQNANIAHGFRVNVAAEAAVASGRTHVFFAFFVKPTLDTRASGPCFRVKFNFVDKCHMVLR